MANSFTLTRAQYDLLVSKCPNWMELRWRKEYTRSWFIGGVHVTGSVAAIENLKQQLKGL